MMIDQPEDTRPTPTIEDYLIILYVMERDQEKAIAARLAEIFEVAPATVTMTLKRMKRDGWIATSGRVVNRQGIQLTDSGRTAARSVMRRHMLMEWMLVDMLKIPWSRIHEEAHLIEHAISDEVATQLQETYSDRKVCPHGNPFPGYEEFTSEWLELTGIEPGQSAIIRRVHEMVEDRPGLLAYLEKNGILPGVRIKIKEKLSFNQTISLEVNELNIVLGFSAARRIYAELIDLH